MTETALYRCGGRLGLILEWQEPKPQHFKAAAVVLIADKSGIWMIHRHNTYHQEAGMMTSLTYTTRPPHQ